MSDPIDENWLTTAKSEQRLNPRELEVYREHRRNVLTWMLNKGQNPDVNIGYAEETVENRGYRLDMFYRWVWDVENRYTDNITKSHANAFMKYLHPQSYSQAYKAAFQKAIQTLFRWQEDQRGKSVNWEPAIRFQSSLMPSSKEALTREERTQLREAVLDHESVPHYNSLTPEQRARWKQYLAQRFRKPKSEVSKQDFKRANSWKWPSLIWTALDAGLRPQEIERAKISWVDTKNALLRIPPEDAVKNNKRWKVGLQDRTATILEKWIEERESYEKYDDSELLWLTQYRNPYGSQALNRRFRKLCDEAGIDRSNRDLSWYSIRHSVGREMVKEMSIGAAAAQLRHKSMNSTLRYIRPSAEERQDALDNMG
ncbi:MAG: tyrosine-type recombinase/integrase [Halobacteriales archaeon]